MILGYRSKLKKIEGKLVQQDALKTLYKMYVDKLPEGTEVDIYVAPRGKPGNLAQLSRLHKCIRILATHAGLTFEAMKRVIKEKTGMIYTGLNEDGEEEMVTESFGDCSYEELDLCIKATIELGEFMNCPVD